MSVLQAYKKQSLLGGWTRVDLLIHIYDRAITSMEACEIANSNADNAAYAKHYIDAHKALLAIQSGLKPEDHEVAGNVARLLHFALVAIENKDFPTAARVLAQLRDGYAAVAEEVNELEHTGKLPSIPENDIYLY